MNENYWQETYNRYGQAIVQRSIRRGLSREQAEDVLQECFLRLYLHFDGMKDPQAAGAYLLKTAHNIVTDHQRRARTWKNRWGALLSLEEVVENTGREPVARVTINQITVLRLLLAALEQLEPKVSRIIWLHHVEGLKYGEISALLGGRPNALAVRAHRAIARLRKNLSDEK